MFEGLGINLPGLLTQLVSFLVIFFILAKLLYPRILQMLDERARRIKESLDAAEKAKQQAASAAEQVEKEIANARVEGQKLIGEAREAAARFRDDQQQRARQEGNLYRSRVRFFRKHYGSGPAWMLKLQIFILTAIKIPAHELLRLLSRGRRGRAVIGMGDLIAFLRDA
jgi:hypothetical protein